MVITNLGIHAQVLAQLYSAEIMARSLFNSSAIQSPEETQQQIESELQNWLCDLVDPKDAETHDFLSDGIVQQPNHFLIPLSVYLYNLDIILQFGHEVSAYSPQGEEAMNTFLKSLSQELVRRQVGVERRLEHVLELLLLD